MNNYGNAEPKILKTLNSDGQVLDDSGNIISDTTDYWKKLYDQAEPKPDKILHSDGTIKDSAGNVIQDSTSFNVKKYNQAEPIPAKYLHADGTIDENPGSGGGGSDLEDNKEVTIDVSQYTQPVEIEPTAGKDGMKKATVTLSNIPYERTLMYRFFRYRNVGHYIDMDNAYVVISSNGGTVPSSYSYNEQDNTLTVNGTVFLRDTSGDLYK